MLGLFILNLRDLAFIESEDRCAGVREQDGRMRSNNELAIFILCQLVNLRQCSKLPAW